MAQGTFQPGRSNTVYSCLTLTARDTLMPFTYDFYFFPDVRHSITQHAIEGALLVQAGFPKRKKRNNKMEKKRKQKV